MNKFYKAFVGILILFMLIVCVRLSTGWRDRAPLYRSYDLSRVSGIRSPEGGWEIRRGDNGWILLSGGTEQPLSQSALQILLALPGELENHTAGKKRDSGNWLPRESLSLRYERDGKESLNLKFYYDDNGQKSSRGFYLEREDDGGRIYFHRLSSGEDFPWENLVDRRIFPDDLRAENIVYYRLYTPREGSEALQYRYELIREGEDWTYRGELGDGLLKKEEINLLMLRLAGLEGEIGEGDESPLSASETRFRVEIHDNRGKRYVLTAGDGVELMGTDYYRVSLEGEKVRLMTRDALSAIARPLNSLLDF